ncbi:MAG: class I mannose-6-phosphate isomerase [Clostridiales bacterium]|nr:class I mannose-6-phosphate isomerase [Clostridiales bacterium]
MDGKYPIKLKPVFKDYLWGGSRLRTMFHKDTPYENTAESWEISCHPDGINLIENGDYEGMLFSDLIQKYPEFVQEGYAEDKFPILVKLIDAEKKLSIQVHPSDSTADPMLGESGKAEMWYIIDAKPRSFIYYGLNQKVSKEELIQRAYDGSICDILNKVKVQKGDVFYILPGTIHAIGEGCLIAEIQQNSNTTFRVFDYDRIGKDGKKRPLHLERAAEVIDYRPMAPDIAQGNNMIATDDFSFSTIFECNYFKVAKICSRKAMTLRCDPKSFHGLLFLEGAGTIVFQGISYSFQAGDSFFLPAGLGSYQVNGTCELLLSSL